jgi:hypothetical protein
MEPGTYNMPSASQGDTWEGFSVTVQINGTPPTSPLARVDIHFRKRPGAAELASALSTDDADEIEITHAEDWEFHVKEQILPLAAGTWYHDIQTTAEDGTVKTYLAGTIKIRQDVTRP